MNERHFSNFHIAGFTYYNGIDVFDQLKVGGVLNAVAEPDNKFDPYAVILLYNDVKLGYIPRTHNHDIHKFLIMGYDNLFDFRINRIDATENPENQIGVLARIRKRE